MPKVIVYELNEVPWRVVDDFVRTHPQSNLAALVARSCTFTSVTRDEGELSPWITWPTLHRGVPNTEHNIAFLGQDPQTFRFEPVWKLLREAGHSIGVFGSLQSWPVPSLGKDDFYVPDTFARDESCHPASLSAFQRFNLENVRANGRVVRSRPGLGASAANAARLWRLGLRTSTVASAALQLVREARDPRYAYRRAVFQATIGFDVFLRAWRRRQPAFATFFTNHVAGLQHRYWQASYPEDYQEGDVVLDSFFSEAIDYGMRVTDRQVGRLMRLAKSEGALLIVASSMGQEAVHKHTTPGEGELQLRSVETLATALGLPTSFSRNLAMEPQVALDFQDEGGLARFQAKVGGLTDAAGRQIIGIARAGKSLSLTVHSPPEVVQSGRARWSDGATKREVTLAEIGMEVLRPDSPGTAYHQPEGILLFYGSGVTANRDRAKVSTEDVAPTILELFGLPAKPYMTGRSLRPRVLEGTPGAAGGRRASAASQARVEVTS